MDTYSMPQTTASQYTIIHTYYDRFLLEHVDFFSVSSPFRRSICFWENSKRLTALVTKLYHIQISYGMTYDIIQLT